MEGRRRKRAGRGVGESEKEGESNRVGWKETEDRKERESGIKGWGDREREKEGRDRVEEGRLDGARRSENCKSWGEGKGEGEGAIVVERRRRSCEGCGERLRQSERERKGEREGKSRWVPLKGQRSVQGRDKETRIGRVREKKRELGLWKPRRENDGTREGTLGERDVLRWKRSERERGEMQWVRGEKEREEERVNKGGNKRGRERMKRARLRE